MPAKNPTGKQRSSPSFIESARRKQIVRAAIHVLARSGSAELSFSKIAKEAGLSSTGMISYYFSSKSELLSEVVSSVLRTAEEYVGPRLRETKSHRDMLHRYIEMNMQFISEHPAETAALVEVVLGAPAGHDAPHLRIEQGGVELLTGVLSEGQQAGEFGEFDPEVMAVAIRGAIDGIVRRLRADPGLDLAYYGGQLAGLFDRATDPESAQGDVRQVTTG